MSHNIIRNILGGQFLGKKVFVKNWKFILYIFALVLFYITILFGVRNTMSKLSQNEDIIKNLRSEYMGKYRSILYQSKREEIEELLNTESSKLIPPSVPPTRIKLSNE